jgi:hypothetical protein
MAGEVIGINTAILSPTGGSVGIGFAVPAATAVPIIDQLREFGETRRGWLGVRIQNVDESTAEALNLGRPRGALVAGIDERGPAKPAGLEVGDVIVRFDNREVKDSRDLPRIVAATPVGKAVDVLVMRKGQEVTKSVTLGRLEDGERQQQAGLNQPPADVPTVTRRVLGLELSGVTDDLKKRYNIKDTVKGVVVTRVDPNSAAADKRIQPGEVIVEVGQEPVSNPADVTRRVEALKKDGGARRCFSWRTPRARSASSRCRSSRARTQSGMRGRAARRAALRRFGARMGRRRTLRPRPPSTPTRRPRGPSAGEGDVRHSRAEAPLRGRSSFGTVSFSPGLRPVPSTATPRRAALSPIREIRRCRTSLGKPTR